MAIRRPVGQRPRFCSEHGLPLFRRDAGCGQAAPDALEPVTQKSGVRRRIDQRELFRDIEQGRQVKERVGAGQRDGVTRQFGLRVLFRHADEENIVHLAPVKARGAAEASDLRKHARWVTRCRLPGRSPQGRQFL